MSQTESHSAQFGLDPQDKATQNAGSGPGSAIEGTTGVKGLKNSEPAEKSTKVGGIDQQAGGNERPGAGSAVLIPEHGSAKMGDESGGLLNKLNPLKKKE